MTEPLKLGWEEWLALPDLGLPAIKAKVDTGARTSALHAVEIEPFGPGNNPQVRFLIQPNPSDSQLELTCSAKVVDRRDVTSSNGETELRYIIESTAQMGDKRWPIQISLTNRDTMAYRMLLGRRALNEDMFVDPNVSFAQPELSFDLYRSIPRRKPVKRPLRVALLSREPDSYSSRRLVEAGEARGHIVEVIDTRRCYMRIGGLRPEVHYDGRVLPYYDAVVPRIGASITSYGTAILRQFSSTGAFCLNSANGIMASRDKLLAHQLLSDAKIGMPITAFASSPERHQGSDHAGGRGAGGREAVAIDPGPRRRAGRNAQGGRKPGRRFSRTGSQFPCAGICIRSPPERTCGVSSSAIVWWAPCAARPPPGSFAQTCTGAEPPKRSNPAAKNVTPPGAPRACSASMWPASTSCNRKQARKCWK